MKRTLLLMGAAIACAISAKTQDFSGTWVRHSKQYVTGPQYVNAAAKQMTVALKADSIVVTTVSPGENGQDFSFSQAISMNGKPSIIIGKTSKRKFSTTLALSPDKKILTLTTACSTPDNENEVDFTRIETWTLSADGKQLYMDKKSVETKSETWEVKAVFVKQ